MANALSVNAAPWLPGASVAQVALAGLVQEGVAGVAGRCRLVPAQVLPVHAVAAQVAPLHAGLATLDPGQLGDLGQSSGLGGGAAGHPAGHGGTGCRGRRRLGHPAGENRHVSGLWFCWFSWMDEAGGGLYFLSFQNQNQNQHQYYCSVCATK